MKTIVGFAGDGIRSDVEVVIENHSELRIQITSSVESMYGRAIRTQVERCLEKFGNPKVSVQLADSGALPLVIEARLEAALCRHLGVPLPTISALNRKPNPLRSRRTRLYLPGNSPKFMPNAGLYGADCLIFDLEDAVAPTEKDAARALVRAALQSVDLGTSESVIRVNTAEMGMLDIEAVTPAGPDIFLIPKVESAQTLIDISERLDQLGSDAGIFALVETALGVQNAFEIASSSSRVIAMTLGIEDYLADIHASDKSAADWANGMILNASRAAGISALAPVSAEIDNEPALEDYARRMCARGFDGVGCIHPRQVPPAHRGFAPTQSEIDAAMRIVTGFESALESGSGVLAVDGKMVDAPVYTRAKRTLQWAGLN
jgi:citrate lyase subunit beta/citryl-CoA lyase